jgi:hypothetical protein
MPHIALATSVPANATVENTLTDSLFEVLDMNSRIEFGLRAAATGLLLDVYSGRDVVAEQFPPNVGAGTTIYPDDFVLFDVAMAGEKLKIRARNTTGAAIILQQSIRLIPV